MEWRPPFERLQEEPEPEKQEPERQPQSEARPLPCPECESTKGYIPVGNYRVQCMNCNALLKKEEVDTQPPEKES
jgi:hypothetical protein